MKPVEAIAPFTFDGKINAFHLFTTFNPKANRLLEKRKAVRVIVRTKESDDEREEQVRYLQGKVSELTMNRKEM